MVYVCGGYIACVVRARSYTHARREKKIGIRYDVYVVNAILFYANPDILCQEKIKSKENGIIVFTFEMQYEIYPLYN